MKILIIVMGLALISVLSACNSGAEEEQGEGRTTAVSTAQAPSAPANTSSANNDALSMYDDNGNGRITCAEARAHGITPVHSDHPAYEFMTDRDGDGIVCE